MSILERDLVAVSGPDTWPFLQSLLSQDVTGLGTGGIADSLLLTPQGKVHATLRVVRRDDDTAWLDLESGFGDRVAETLGRYRIRVKVEIECRGQDWGMVAWRGDGAPGGLQAGVPTTAGVVAAPLAGGDGVPGGVDIIGPRAALEPIAAWGLDPDAYEQWRVAAGVPSLAHDLDETVIPQEALLEHTAVSFTKGCFLGQELVCRIDTRGHVNRFLRRLRSDPEAGPLAVGAPVVVADKPVGSVTSAVPGIALGYVRREVQPPAAATVSGVLVLVEEITRPTAR